MISLNSDHFYPHNTLLMTITMLNTYFPGVTILPLLSQVEPSCDFTDEERESLTVRIQNAGTEVVEAKAGGKRTFLILAQLGYIMKQ